MGNIEDASGGFDLEIGASIRPGRDAHRSAKTAGKMRLVGETGRRCGIGQRMTEPDHAGGEADSSLSLVAMRCHAGGLLKSAEQTERRKSGRMCNVGKMNVLVQMVVEKIPRQPDRARLATSSWYRGLRAHVSLKQPRDEACKLLFALQLRSGRFRTAMNGAKQRGQARIANDRTGKRRRPRRLGTIAEHRPEPAHFDIERAQAPAVIVNRPACMRFFRIDRVKTRSIQPFRIAGSENQNTGKARTNMSAASARSTSRVISGAIASCSIAYRCSSERHGASRSPPMTRPD
jgi:hypothetical protein